MRYSQFFGQTTKNIPHQIQATSHRLLYQAGFIREISAGRYALLPLGYRTWIKILQIIDEQMQKIGAQRIITPSLHPIAIWQATHRDKAFGEEMHTVEDHHGTTFALGATAEGLMTELVKRSVSSHKDLPVVIYQFSQKFRDEKRPRGGLLRLREFMMKDAYSFHATQDDLWRWYERFYRAYQAIAKRLDIKAIPVIADSGPIGGDYCHEFMVISRDGEGKILVCDKCDYAANQEMAAFRREPINLEEKEKAMCKVMAKKITTIQKMVMYYKAPAWRMLKAVIYQVDDEWVGVLIRGDLEINEVKLRRMLDAQKIRLATNQELKKLGTQQGFVTPVYGIKDVTFYGDASILTVRNFIGGGQKDGVDLKNVNYPRDFEVRKITDLAVAKGGEACPICKQGRINLERAIEFGHVFKQDLFYTKSHEAKYQDAQGQEQFMWSGAYGIGVERAMATVVETHHDEKGIVWPASVAPFLVHLISLESNEKVRQQAYKVYTRLIEKKVEVLWDDRRQSSAGEKLVDADLIGCPYRVIVSAKSLAQGGLEVKRRDQQRFQILSLLELIPYLKKIS